MFYQLLTPSLIDKTIEFIKPNEYLCTGLSEKLLAFKKMPTISKEHFFLLFNDNNDICGILCFCSNGRVLHFLPFTEFSSEIFSCTIKLLQNFYSRTIHTLFCIVGMGSGCDFLTKCAIQAGLSSPQIEIDYTLMVFKQQIPTKNTLSIQKTNLGLSLHRCFLQDLDLLDDLNTAYYFEEVFSPFFKCNKFILRKELEKSLQNQITYALITEKNIAVSKVATNAIGLNWCQLGGVYTHPLYRNKGCASSLVSYIAQKLKVSGFNTVLFVKKNNIAAIKTYLKAGFVKKDIFKIIYFK